jgi:recombinational DNA repair ATPase RecF
MSEYLTNNTAFTKFTLTETYEIFVDDKPLNSYSGGQVDLVCTLFRLAAARVLAELRYGKLPFILLDSFGDSLDDNNFSLIVNFLQTQLPNVDQVILTAHHSVSVAGAYRINL